MQVAYIPIVCGASLFDLSVGDPKCRPNRQMGYEACKNSEQNDWQEGNYGAGTGASVGKLLGFDKAMKSGQGAYGLQHGDLQVASIVAVNACGNVYDFENGELLAGIYDQTQGRILAVEDMLAMQEEAWQKANCANTTIGCIVTNAKLSKAECSKVAGIAHDGYARAIRPVHMMSDGDTIFVLSTGEVEANLDVVGVLAADTMAMAIKRGVMKAEGAYGLPSSQEIKK